MHKHVSQINKVSCFQNLLFNSTIYCFQSIIFNLCLSEKLPSTSGESSTSKRPLAYGVEEEGSSTCGRQPTYVGLSADERPLTYKKFSAYGVPSAFGEPPTYRGSSAFGGLLRLTIQSIGLELPAEPTVVQEARTAKLWRFVTCKCGGTTIASNFFSCFCNNCEKIVCAVNNCGKTFCDEHRLYTHQNRSHSDPLQCYGCKTLKPASVVLGSMKCPCCGSMWCLQKKCGYQGVDAKSLAIHQGVKHKKAVI